VSNFVTGLVRRGAGLPPPVSIRPAAGPAQMLASPPAAAEGLKSRQGITPSPAVALSDHGRGLDVSRPDFPVPAEPAPLPVPRPAAAPEPVNWRLEKPSPKTQETRCLQPRSEPPKAAPAPLATLQVQGEDRSLARAGDAARPLPPPSASTTVPTATGENLEPHTPPPQEGTLPLIARLEPKPHPDAVSGPTPAHPLPRPEPSAVARIQPAPTTSASRGREKTHDSRSIQVKIGKVEIRSNQPVPVVRTTCPSRTSGFDDLRLARTYLDRGTR
jgi:hypothetical protein